MPGHNSLEQFFTDTTLMIQTVAQTIAENDIFPIRQQLDDDKEHTELIEPLFETILLELGLQQVLVDEDPPSLIDSCVFYEEISRGDCGIAIALGCTTWCLIPILFEPYGRPDLVRELTQVFHDGKIHFGCFAMTEPDAGCDIENPRMEGRRIRTRARLEGDEWVINGAKQWPSNSGIASLYLTVCTTDPALGDDGIALIYVPYPIEGVTFGKFENKAGMQTDRNCTIYFDDVRVPKHYRAAGPGDDAKLLHQNLVLGSVGSAAMSIGTARNIFELVTRYTSERIVAGKPIKEHSVNACALADMSIGIETARTYMLNVAYMLDHPETYGPRWSPEMLAKARIAKVYAADMSVMVANKAMEMMASFGYTRDADVEKHWRDNKILQLVLGGAQLGRLDIARHFCDLEML
jgi:alkylation response protein AidB-like acyl-CoA dehydrogenase